MFYNSYIVLEELSFLKSALFTSKVMRVSDNINGDGKQSES